MGLRRSLVSQSSLWGGENSVACRWGGRDAAKGATRFEPMTSKPEFVGTAPTWANSTLFNALGGQNAQAQAANFPFCHDRAELWGSVAVPDPRLKLLSDVSSSKGDSFQPGVEFVDIARGWSKGRARGRAGQQIPRQHSRSRRGIVACGLRCFPFDDDVIHVLRQR